MNGIEKKKLENDLISNMNDLAFKLKISELITSCILEGAESLNIYNTINREIVFRYIKDLNPNKRNIMFFKESEDIILSTVAEIIIDKLLDEDFRTKITELIDTDIGDDGSYEIYTCDE
jgi:hypothetical protein